LIITEKAVSRSVFLTTWYSISSAELTKNALIQTVFFLAILPTGIYDKLTFIVLYFLLLMMPYLRDITWPYLSS